MEQIGCAIGLCFGLSNFTKDVLANANVPKDSKRLIRSLTGYSKSNYKTSSRIAGGYLCGKHSNIDSDILTLVKVHVIINRWPKDYEIEAYRRFESDEGQNFIPLSLKHGRQIQLLSNTLKIVLFVMEESRSF